MGNLRKRSAADGLIFAGFRRFLLNASMTRGFAFIAVRFRSSGWTRKLLIFFAPPPLWSLGAWLPSPTSFFAQTDHAWSATLP